MRSASITSAVVFLVLVAVTAQAQPNFHNVRQETFLPQTETEPWVSPDELSLYYEIDRIIGSGQDRDIYTSTRPDTASPWSPPVKLANVNVDPKVNGGPFLSSDNLTLYYRSSDQYSNVKLWQATRSETSFDFSNPIVLPGPINGGFNSFSPSVTDDERMIFYTHRPEDGFTEELYFSERGSIEDPFGAPQPLSELNTPYHESRCWVSGDALMLFWQCDKPGGEGGFDIYYAEREYSEEPFGPALHIPSISSPEQDRSPHYNSETGKIYFGRNARNAEGNIYSALPLNLAASSSVGKPGDIATIAISAVGEITDLEALTLCLEFDPAVVDVISLSSVLPTSSMVHGATQGCVTATMAWDSPISGVDLLLGVIAFRISDDALPGDYTDVAFNCLSGGPKAVDGSITVLGDPVTPTPTPTSDHEPTPTNIPTEQPEPTATSTPEQPDPTHTPTPSPTPESPEIVCDDFDDGDAEGWTVESGLWEAANGVYSGEGDGISKQSITRWVGSSSWDTRTTVDFFDTNEGPFNNFFILFAIKDSENFSFAGAWIGSQKWVIGQYVDNTWTPAAEVSDPDLAPGLEGTIELLVNGESVSLSLDGEEQIRTTIDGLTDGEIGLATVRSHIYFDNLCTEDVTFTAIKPRKK